MSIPAARMGDKFLDTDTVGGSSGDVFINNLPAARLTDLTLGHPGPPLFIPHGYYPPVELSSGSGSVFVNGLPMARLTSTKMPHVDPPHLPISPDFHDSIIITSSNDVFAG